MNTKMQTFKVIFKANESFEVLANDVEHAEEVAIDTLEMFGIVHSEIVGVCRVDSPSAHAQYVGNDAEGMAYYINVSL